MKRPRGSAERRLVSMRRGVVLPMIALFLVVLIGFLALAIDLGMLAIAKSQVQQVADLAALTAMRTANGNPATNYNQTAATTNAQSVVSYNTILSQQVQGSQLSLSYGSYDYSSSTDTFSANFPALSGSPTTAVTATVTSNTFPAAFSKVLKTSFLPAVTATAQAVHRPRDIALTLDLSGSMRMGTCLGFDFYTNSRTTNNNDSSYPKFGHYSTSASDMQGPSTDRTSGDDSYTIPPANTTATTSAYGLTYVNNFLQNAAYASTLVRAFDSYTSTNNGASWTAPTSGSPQLPPSSYATTPGGDVPLFDNGSTTSYATDIYDVLKSTSRSWFWELDGYSNFTSGSLSYAALGQSNYTSTPFNGYMQGPAYYGKTFFIWPPDPRRPLSTGTKTAWSTTANDTTTIRQFLNDDGYGWTTDLANNAFTTTLSSAITSTTATSIGVNSPTPFPASGSFSILINSEILLVTAGNGAKTWTVTRGTQGSAGATHGSGTTVALMTAPPVIGIYTAANTSVSPGKTPSTSQTWPWPNDGGTTLSNYLTTSVYAPYTTSSTARFLQTTDTAYQQIMRLYNWNYAVDSVGTTPCDWRIRFFGTNNNTVLFQTTGGNTGELALPGSGSYTINYNEILRWLTETPNPFPTQLRAGHIKYYGSIPTAITGTWPNYGSTDQQFWAGFIDHALGFYQTSAGVYEDISNMVGYGDDINWGGTQVTGVPTNYTQYMNYTDNPQRPLTRLWFSPMMMVDYLHNYNMESNLGPYYYMNPGDSYEAPIYVAKQAYLAAITTMQNNHPNDWFTIVPYSNPRVSASDTSGRFNMVRSPLGTNYTYASNAILFPFSTLSSNGSENGTELTPFTADPSTSLVPCADFLDAPRADGDTCFAMALMLCHNQFASTSSTDTTLRSFVSSSPITFPANMAGGNGRTGAQKVVIFETDGLPNCSATANLVSASNYNYYQIRYDMNNPNGSQYPSIDETNINDPGVLSQVYTLVQNLATAFGTTRNPFRLYGVGFGPVFQGANASGAESTLQSMQYYAGTQSSASTPLASYQIVTGTDAQMSANMVSTFTQILENGVQIALIK
jgi:Flp pilus assembly protein TadG